MPALELWDHIVRGDNLVLKHPVCPSLAPLVEAPVRAPSPELVKYLTDSLAGALEDILPPHVSMPGSAVWDESEPHHDPFEATPLRALL